MDGTLNDLDNEGLDNKIVLDTAVEVLWDFHEHLQSAADNFDSLAVGVDDYNVFRERDSVF